MSCKHLVLGSHTEHTQDVSPQCAWYNVGAVCLITVGAACLSAVWESCYSHSGKLSCSISVEVQRAEDEAQASSNPLKCTPELCFPLHLHYTQIDTSMSSKLYFHLGTDV